MESMHPPSQFTADTIVRWHPDQVAAEIDGEVVVMSIAQGKYVGFDGMASMIWRRLERPQPVAELCDGLIRDFDGSPEVIRADVTELLASLEALDLIVIDAAVSTRV